MRALITGGAGFIGSHLADRLLRAGWRVSIVDDLSTGRKANVPPKANFRHDGAGGVGCCESVEWIFHFAAAVGVEYVPSVPDRVLGDAFRAGEMAVIAKSLGARFFYASSSEVYGITSDWTPTQFYAVSKRMGECFALARCPDAVIGRFFNTVGPRQRADFGMVLPRMCAAAKAKRPIPVVGTGEQTRSFLHVHDAVEAVWQIIQSGQSGVFDIGSDREISMRHLAERVQEIAGVAPAIEWLPARAHDTPRRSADPVRLRKLGWRPTKSLADAIRDTLEE